MSLMRSKPQIVLFLSWASQDWKLKLQLQQTPISSPVRGEKGDQENESSRNHKSLYL